MQADVTFSHLLIEHKFSSPGCGSVLVLDGNCKNYRDVCNAREARYVEYEGLEGMVKTGCMNTPRLESRFCELHSPRVMNCVDGDEVSSGRGKERVLVIIIGKRETRSGTHYQVSSIQGML